MGSPKMKGPSAEETELQRIQLEQINKRDRQLRQEEIRERDKNSRDQQSMMSGRVGSRSILSGDWQGFQAPGMNRGGDVGAV